MSKNTEVQKAHYDRMARECVVHDLPWEFDRNHRLAYLNAPYQFCRTWFSGQKVAGKSVLDFGCGSSALSLYCLRNREVNVTGVDISPWAIQRAQERASLLNCESRCAFDVGNGEDLPYSDESFDYVLDAGALSCLDLEKASHEMWRVTKPNGYVILIETLSHNPLLNMSRRIKLWRGEKTKWSVDHVLSVEKLQKVAAKFRGVEQHYFDFTTLALAPLSKIWRGRLRSPANVLQQLDAVLLKRPSLQKMAFKIVCILQK